MSVKNDNYMNFERTMERSGYEMNTALEDSLPRASGGGVG